MMAHRADQVNGTENEILICADAWCDDTTTKAVDENTLPHKEG